MACLAALPNLTDLHVGLANDSGLAIELRQALQRPPVQLPGVKKLRISGVHNPGCLIRACPSVRHLSITSELDEDWKSALGEIRHMLDLICVELMNLRGWKVAQLIGEDERE